MIKQGWGTGYPWASATSHGSKDLGERATEKKTQGWKETSSWVLWRGSFCFALPNPSSRVWEGLRWGSSWVILGLTHMTKRKRQQAQNSSQGDWKRRLELSGVGDVNSGCRGPVWFSRVSQSHGLHCPSGALSASLQVVRTLEELRKDNPYPSPTNEWLLTQSGG